MVRDECSSEYEELWYTDVGSTSPPTCTTPTPTPPASCQCGCARTLGTAPCYVCNFSNNCLATPGSRSWGYKSEFYQQVELDYLDQVNWNGSTNWRFDDGSGVIVTNLTVSYTHVRLRFQNLAVPNMVSSTTGNGPESCCTWAESKSSTYALYVWFWERARYTNNVSAIGVYGSAAQYANWTVQITAADCIVRDDLGNIQHQWALGAYTMEGLRLAIDGTAELVGRRIALSPSVALRNAAASAIPPQGPYPIGTGLNDEAKIKLRSAGDEFESYQVAGLAAWESRINNSNPQGPLLNDLTEKWHSGNITSFRSGFRLTAQRLLQSPTLAWPPDPVTASATNVTTPSACSTAPANCMGGSFSPNFGGQAAGFGISTDSLTGTVYEYDDGAADGQAQVRSYGCPPSDLRYACENKTAGKWIYFGVMWELERV